MFRFKTYKVKVTISRGVHILRILIQGPDRKIQPLLNALASNIQKYDPEYTLAVNLERILEVELPSSCSLDLTFTGVNILPKIENYSGTKKKNVDFFHHSKHIFL